MPNRNYQAGVRFERARKKVWEQDGNVVLRTAGSHGPFDLVAIGEDRVRLIQCKRVQTKAQAMRLIRLFEAKPPLFCSGATQYLEVYVKDLREVQVGVV